MLATGFAGFSQIEENPRCAVDAVARDKRCSNQAQQSGVLLRAIRDGLQQPLVIAARGYLQNATQHLHAVLISMRLDELVDRADSPRDLVLGLWHRSSAKCRMLACVHQILGTPRPG